MSENITTFPESPISAGPTELYADIVYPQIIKADRRVYTPGPITSGWAIHITHDVPDVISMNAEFALKFARHHLSNRAKPIHVPLSDQPPLNLADAHLTVPHAVGSCKYPTGEQQKWGEFDYYIVWLMTMMGLEPSLATSFKTALAEGISIAAINDHRPESRQTRTNEVKKVFANAVRFMQQSINRTRPVNAVVALPEPMRPGQPVSIGTKLEAQFARALALPLRRLLLHPQHLTAEMQSNVFWKGPVAQWLLKEFAALPTNGATTGITVGHYQHSEEW
jgi:hypothetical protein